MVAALQIAQASDSTRHAVGSVGEPAHGDRDEAVEEGEIQPADQPELSVGDVERVLDRLGEDRQELPIEEVQHIDEAQDRQHAPGARVLCGLEQRF